MRKSTIMIKNYLIDKGFDELVNSILLEEFEDNEAIGAELKKERKKTGLTTAKGRLSPAYAGYHAYFNRKLALLKNLAVTVGERNKLNGNKAGDGKQLEIEAFMRKVV